MLSPFAHHIGSREEFSQEEAATVGAARRLPFSAKQDFHPFPAILAMIFVYRHLFILPKTRATLAC